ncbi:hypothetical protein EV11_1875 [Prochlorococcus sp. SS52]|nr:hypothetical protein EV04_1779 [Prochlorococcus marinus str. LG]KGG20396.1 hypothetical protein EV08_0979 [Prochlorococcus marinus str. SS2]KGG24065.1 hypothetical protein EV09_0669 [Prochlorococcus marinus str. SS35]KGG31676.1 hypothetical protein EV10_1773 [Prochlorococcus marinus str. SS51]KGG34743.1 hypothetical protein EV11_1875 [Prochlorococcus sp. SS52]
MDHQCNSIFAFFQTSFLPGNSYSKLDPSLFNCPLFEQDIFFS